MRANPAELSIGVRAEAVAAFDARYGEMQRALWCLSRRCRPDLVSGNSSVTVETLVWTLKSWWGVQGVRSETRTLMAAALPLAVDWSPELFEEEFSAGADAQRFAVQAVSALVERSVSLGVPRREYSLASKVLHWLLPWKVPVYDAFVRRYLGIPEWDHPEAYQRIVKDIFAMASEAAGDLSWAGSIDPVSPLQALDKCLWWLGGGDSDTAARVRDPWRVIDRLGLERC